MSKVIVALSGGVDSSVCAWLLQQQGHEVEGFFMKNWEEDQDEESCPATQDLIDAMQVCDTLGIHLHAENFSKEYKNRVFHHFIQQYREGKTPNPDILCNREIKFEVLLNRAKSLNADYLATGHYAGIHWLNDRVYLRQAADADKDQTYFLYALSEKQLASSLFPLANYQKKGVRDQAKKLGLKTYNKKDSTGICFIGKRNFQDFLSHYLPTNKGEVLDEKGVVVGEHAGIAFYTLGQRKGLGIGGKKGGVEQPWYVYDKCPESNQLRVVQGEKHPLLNHRYLKANQLNWIQDPPDINSHDLYARLRHRQPLQKVQTFQLNSDSATVCFAEPQFAIAPGQSVVFYQRGFCLGGGVICHRW